MTQAKAQMESKPKISSLTKEQKEKFDFYVKKWLDVGTCTEPANRPAAEEGIRLAYKLADIKAPEKIFWFDSPLTGMIGVTVYFYAQEKKIPLNQLTMEHVDECIKMNILDFCCYGQHDAGWLSFYDFFRTECGLVEETEKCQGLSKIAENCGWWWCYNDVAFACERHNVCELDDFGRLHCEDGPAIAFPDGYEIFAYNGVIIPRKAIMEKETLTLTDITSEQNAEVKRTLIDIYGVAKYLEQSKAQVIDMDMILVDAYAEEKEYMPRALYHCDGNAYLCGTDGSTHRVYFMSVDPEAKTCAEAHKSISGFDDKDITVNS